jgi:Mg2+-importing ATPase
VGVEVRVRGGGVIAEEAQYLESMERRTESSVRWPIAWMSWLFGAVVLVTVIYVALHFAEERALLEMFRQAEPWWLLAAVLLQAGTYFAQGEIWRSALRSRGFRLRLTQAYRLSLAKLFVDQVLPTGGLSGATVVAHALETSGVPLGVVMASLVVTLVSYYAAYVLSLAAAVAITTLGGHSNWLIAALSALSIVFAVGMSSAVVTLSGRRPGSVLAPLYRLPTAKAALGLLKDADSRLVRSPRLAAQATAWQLVIVMLDAGSLWMLVRAVGASATPAAVFGAFMVASLLRTVGFVPGGLGTFEAASVYALKLAGVPLAEALSATLLFRGLSFWFPMLPGLAFSRAALRRSPHGAGVNIPNFWSLNANDVLRRVASSADGLSSEAARRRLERFGPNEVREHERFTRAQVLWNQLRSPLLLLLVFAAAASVFTGEWADAAVIGTILTASVGIGYSREYRAASAAARLRERVQTQAKVLRDGAEASIPLRQVVPGDVVVLSAGSFVPADGLLLEATDFFVNEGLLTGESYPVEKRTGIVEADATVAARNNSVYLGANVRSGTARCVVVHTGAATEFGAIAHRLVLRPPQTEFDRGLLRFGYLVTVAIFAMVLLVFAANVWLGRPAIETLLFSIALAVGMSPELLPAILSVNLARGATVMARAGVLVRRLNAIENLGSMDTLCTDKTGTLTEGVVRVEGAYDARGAASDEVLRLAAINSALQTGMCNPLDDAVLKARTPDLAQVEKLGEVPYDFTRKRTTVLIRDQEVVKIVVKGAFEQVLAVCTQNAQGDALTDEQRTDLIRRFEKWCGEGTRVLAVASRVLEAASPVGRADERELRFAGFLTFIDHPKEGVEEAIADLARLGVSVKLITGDAKLVAQHVAAQVGLRADRVLTGKQLAAMLDEALWVAAENADLFVEVDPHQKERIIRALRKTGHVVGFLGDGINDAPAMHAADTSISVDEAADVAREAADFVLLERHLDVIRRGIEEGRTTFANTLKYVLTTMSANLGNMMSMAAASLFLPFLPLLAGQVLLNNFLSDIPAIGLASDSVDSELIERPRRWNVRFIGRFMMEFGLLSSLFDFLTFATLVGYFAAAAPVFRTAWFVESLLTELLIALVVRTRRPFFRSRPGNLLLVSTLLVVALTFAIPYLPLASLMGFTPLSIAVLATVAVITCAYVVVTELAKKQLYRRAHE